MSVTWVDSVPNGGHEHDGRGAESSYREALVDHQHQPVLDLEGEEDWDLQVWRSGRENMTSSGDQETRRS